MSESTNELSDTPDPGFRPGEIPLDIREHQHEIGEYAAKQEAKGLTRRQITKRIGIAGLTVGPFAALLSACGGGSKTSATAHAAATETASDVKSGRKLTMFASNCGLTATWYAQGYRQQKYYASLLGIDYTYADGKLDPTQQSSAIQNAATKKWDIAFFDLVAPGTANDPIKSMISNGTLVFEGPGQVTRPGQDIGVKSWMHQDEYTMGNAVGQVLVNAAGGSSGSGNVVITMGPAAAVQVPIRAQGFKDALKGTGFKVVAEDYGNWDPNKTTQLWEAYVNKYPNIAIGYFENDDMAFAGLKVLKGASRSGKTKIGGCDGMPPACQAVKTGAFAATYRHSSERVHVTPLFIGRGLKMNLLSDSQVPRDLKLDGPLVTPENADSIAFLQQDNMYQI